MEISKLKSYKHNEVRFGTSRIEIEVRIRVWTDMLANRTTLLMKSEFLHGNTEFARFGYMLNNFVTLEKCIADYMLTFGVGPVIGLTLYNNIEPCHYHKITEIVTIAPNRLIYHVKQSEL